MEQLHDTQWRKANGLFWATASKCQLTSDDVHATIYSAYGKTHTTELTPAQLNSLSAALRKRAMPEAERKLEQMRRRVIGAVRRYCKVMGYRTDTLYLVRIVERDGTPFNRMTAAELMRKYNTFSKLARELENPTQPSRGEEMESENKN